MVCASLIAGQATCSAEVVTPAAAVGQAVAANGEWVKLTEPIVQKQGDVELKITEMRSVSGALEINAVMTPKTGLSISRLTVTDNTGTPLPANYTSAGLQTAGMPFGIVCAAPPKGSTSLRDLKLVFAPPCIKRDLGTLTLEQLRYPCLLGGRIASQAGEWSLETWPGHYLNVLYSDESAPMGLYTNPTNQKRYLVLKLFTMNRPGEKWAVDPVDVVVLDAEERRLRSGYVGRLGGELLPVQPNRSYWGFHSIPASQTQPGALVRYIDPFGPAAAAGMKEGDIITQWADKKLDGTNAWTKEALECVPGRPVKIFVLRDGKSVTLTATSVPDPQWDGIDEPAKASADWLHKKVGLEKSSQFWMQCYIVDAYENGDPLPESFTPVELQFSVREPIKGQNPVEFKFAEVPIPGELLK